MATSIRHALRLGLVAAPGPAAELAEELAGELAEALEREVSDEVRWDVRLHVDETPLAGTSATSELIEILRDRFLRDDLDLLVCVTEVPLHRGARPVVADASATHRVGLVSLPALGALGLRRRALQTVLRLVGALVGEGPAGRDERLNSRRTSRIGGRLRELAAPVRAVIPDDGESDLAYVAAVVRGNLRVLAGMIRANRPWRFVATLSRALAAALTAVALSLLTNNIWTLADRAGSGRLVALTVVSLLATIASLIVAHELWERSRGPRERERVILFNAATTATVTLGIVVLYAALFAVTLAGSALVLSPSALADGLGHRVTFADYATLAWMVSSLATIGGALGGGLETDRAVRDAAYGRHSDEGTS